MSLANKTGTGLSGLDQMRSLMASGRKPGILASLDFELVEVDFGKAVFVGKPGEPPMAPFTVAMRPRCWIPPAVVSSIPA